MIIAPLAAIVFCARQDRGKLVRLIPYVVVGGLLLLGYALVLRSLTGSLTVSARVPSLAGSVPMSSEAADLLGKQLVLDELDWLNVPNNKPVNLAGKATLVRWWTDTCPSCAMSLPAIERLRKKFATRGLQTLAIYHPKPPRDVAAHDVLQMAKTIGYTGWVATDLQWKTLQRVYTGAHERRSTSVCFLLDEKGVIRYVHPGPAFGPTGDPEKRQLNQDYLNITAAIEALVSEP